MCGRYCLALTWDDLLELLRLVGPPADLTPRYNIAPSQQVAAIREEADGRQLVLLHWGLIPFWANDPKIGYKMINARAETAHQSPAFRAAFRGRHCLVPANGFFEWDKRGGTRQPWYIQRADGNPMVFAGLWEHWEEKGGKTVIESCTILTTTASPDIEHLHDRMPVILESGEFDPWLDPEEHNVERLRTLLHPAREGLLILQPVSDYVNKPAYDGPDCIRPVTL